MVLYFFLVLNFSVSIKVEATEGSSVKECFHEIKLFASADKL